MRYFARVTAGLEEVAWAEIAERPGAILKGFGHRRIDFSFSGSLTHLLSLRCVDDIYIFVEQIDDLDHTRASLAILANQLRSIDFAEALAQIKRVRLLPKVPKYSVTASYLGRRNYSRYDLEKAAHTGLAKLRSWQFVPNQPENYASHDIDIRLLLEEDRALIGVRLGALSLHRRPYKVANLPGSLKPPVASSMVRLARLQAGEILLDLMCGAGTIPIEAAASGKAGLIIGGDFAAQALDAARRNSSRTFISLYQGDATALPFAGNSIDVVITNLPWGQQVASGSDLTSLYRCTLVEIERVLTKSGRAVLLTDQLELLYDALKCQPALQLTTTLPISVFGRHPVIHVIGKSFSCESN